jgi:hypothetical protein
MDELPAGAAGIALLRIAGDAMAYALEATLLTVTEIIRHGRKLARLR